MKKPSPQITPPLCENCNFLMRVVNHENIKMWECPNRIECGGQPRLYYGRNKLNLRARSFISKQNQSILLF